METNKRLEGEAARLGEDSYRHLPGARRIEVAYSQVQVCYIYVPVPLASIFSSRDSPVLFLETISLGVGYLFAFGIMFAFLD